MTAAWNAELQSIKNDVSHLDTHGLLTRDTKRAVVTVQQGTKHLALCSVPLSLSAWVAGTYRTRAALAPVTPEAAAAQWDTWWASVDAFMAEQQLDMAVMLTSHRETRADQTSERRRDLVLVYRGAAPELERVVRGLEAHDTHALAQGDEVLDLRPWKGERRLVSGKRERASGLDADGRVQAAPGVCAAVLRQGNAHANRKIVQPALLRVLQHVW